MNIKKSNSLPLRGQNIEKENIQTKIERLEHLIQNSKYFQNKH